MYTYTPSLPFVVSELLQLINVKICCKTVKFYCTLYSPCFQNTVMKNDMYITKTQYALLKMNNDSTSELFSYQDSRYDI